MSKRLISRYQNGNYEVLLYEDGTKIKQTDDENFVASFPDSMDLKITDYCDKNCPMCHEKSSIYGKHARLDEPFLDTLQAGTELAIGGGNPLSHPHLVPFLARMKKKGIICNVTINEAHLLDNLQKVEAMLEEMLIWGLGISIADCNAKTLAFAKKHPNVVFHLINGLDYDMEKLYDQNFKILILGYKQFGRGKGYFSQKIQQKMQENEQNLTALMQRFFVVSFDNLALKQLKVQSQLGNETFQAHYMGDDGEGTMYVDLVNRQFALSSTTYTRHEIADDIFKMFEVVKKDRINKVN